MAKVATKKGEMRHKQNVRWFGSHSGFYFFCCCGDGVGEMVVF